MKVVNRTEGDRIQYAIVDDDGVTLNWFGGRVGFIKTDQPDRVIEEKATAWRDGYVAGLADAEADSKDTVEIYLAGMNSACEQRDHWRAEAERWRATIGEVMPADFKDWHQNNPSDLPLVTRSVIESLQKRESLALEHCDHWRAEAERWRVIADNAVSDHAQADTDSLRALAERNELRELLAAISAQRGYPPTLPVVQ